MAKTAEYVAGGLGFAALVGGGYYFYEKSHHTTATPTTAKTHTVTRTVTKTQRINGTPQTIRQTVTKTVTVRASQTPRTLRSSTPTQARSATPTSVSSHCSSPYGCNPKVKPTNCPSGYQPIYRVGYGWVCQETTTQVIANLKSAYSLASCADGTGVTISGITVGGLSTWQQAQLAQQVLNSKCGGGFGIYWQQGTQPTYLIVPSARVSQLMAEGASDIYAVTYNGRRGAQLRYTAPNSTVAVTHTATNRVVSAPHVLANGGAVSFTASGTVALMSSTTIRATATNITSPLYSWWVKNPSGVWKNVQYYSVSNTYTFVPNQTGNWEIVVYAKAASTPKETGTTSRAATEANSSGWLITVS